jgi:hypothetical protein
MAELYEGLKVDPQPWTAVTPDFTGRIVGAISVAAKRRARSSRAGRSILHSWIVSDVWAAPQPLLRRFQSPRVSLIFATTNAKDNTAIELRKQLRNKRKQFVWLRFKLLLPRQSIRAIYFVRNYGTAGFLPIDMAVLASLCLYGVISLDWLRHITPPRMHGMWR